MSAAASIPAGGRVPAVTLKFDSVGACILMLMPLALLMSWPRLWEVWQTGAFFDTDDAMRMVEVRDLLAGQGWFDLVAHRLAPPAGLPMHWSRVVDVPLALLVEVFGLVADPVHAERLARIVFPLALQAAMTGATAWVAGVLAGASARLPAAFLIVLSGIAYGQFQPGRIDHHAPQILLLMLATGTTLRSMQPSGTRLAAVTGLLVALSLAISLENLPFFAVLLAVPGLAWAFGGEAYRRTLRFFCLGLGIALPVLFAATVPPWRYGIGTCDALSIAHLTGLMTGVAGLGVLASLSPRLPTRPGRFGALATLGMLIVALVLATTPACLRGPYATLDPLLTHLWLSYVTEAQPLMTAIRLHPDTLTIVVCPIVAGALAALLAAWRHRGLARLGWLVLLALIAIGLSAMVWEIRVASSVAPLALLPGAWIAARSLSFALGRARAAWLLLPFAATMPFAALAWALVPSEPQAGPAAQVAQSCLAPSAMDPLRSLPVGLVFAPIDLGSHLLVHTDLTVIGAPYHRNQAGNLTVIRAFIGTPEEARRLIRATGARYLVSCAGLPQMTTFAKESPHGLAAAILTGRAPEWLKPLLVGGSTLQVFAIE